MGKSSTSKTGQRILARMRKIKPFLAQCSLTLTQKRCGNPKCRCAREGPIHETALLTWKEGKKTHTLYVSKNLRNDVTQWLEEWKILKNLIHEMSKAQREFLTSCRKNTKR